MTLTDMYIRNIGRKRLWPVLALTMGLILFVYPLQISQAALAGDSDLTFAPGGIATTDFSAGGDIARDIVIQPDGRIVSAGETSAGGNYNFALTRHNADGSLDNTFGNVGKSVADFGATDQGLAVALQSDGKIVTAGRTDLNRSEYQLWKFAVARHNADGSLDPSFGINGVVTTEMGGYRDEAFAVVVQPDGKIIVGGHSSSLVSLNIGLVRYNSDGSLDASFGSGGKVIAPLIGVADYCHEVLLRPDGRIVATGYTQTTLGMFDFVASQYNSDGSQDLTFGDNGSVVADFAGPADYAYSAALQQDGKIVLAGGSSPITGGSQFGLARLNSDGQPDSSFGTNGRVRTSFANWDTARGVVVASDGKIVAVGHTLTPGFAVARYNTDGRLDSSFGSGGKTITAFPNGSAQAFTAGLQSDGKIVVGGYSRSNGPNDFALVRYEAVSTPDALITNTTNVVNSLNLPAGTASSLNSKVNDALAAWLAGDEAGACASLQAFISHVQAQTGKKITESQAQELLNAANNINATIGCQ